MKELCAEDSLPIHSNSFPIPSTCMNTGTHVSSMNEKSMYPISRQLSPSLPLYTQTQIICQALKNGRDTGPIGME